MFLTKYLLIFLNKISHNKDIKLAKFEILNFENLTTPKSKLKY